MEKMNLSTYHEQRWQTRQQQQTRATKIYQLFIVHKASHFEWLTAALMTAIDVVVDEFDEKTQFE